MENQNVSKIERQLQLIIDRDKLDRSDRNFKFWASALVVVAVVLVIKL